MAASDENAVGAIAQRLEHELRVYTSAAHNPDRPHIGGVVNSSCTCQVGRAVGAPIAQKSNDYGFKLFTHSFFSSVQLSVVSFQYPDVLATEPVC
jgi:hypothetical protein